MTAQDLVTAVQQLLGRPLPLAAPLVAPPGWQRVDPPLPTVPPLQVTTLSALVTYVTDRWIAPDTIPPDPGPLAIHVVSPTHVDVIGPLSRTETAVMRPTYLRATAPVPAHPWGQPCSHEAFLVWLATGFVDTPDRHGLATFLASIESSVVETSQDDGVTQQVEIRRGAAMKSRHAVPNPVRLQPYRTFHGVIQPASPFLLRLQRPREGERPLLALHEADGGAWRLEAVLAIANQLRINLPAGRDLVVLA